MAVQLLITFSSFLLEHKHLLALYQWRYYFTHYFCTFYGRCANCDGTVVVNQQNLFKLNSLSTFSILNVMNEKLHAFLYLELLTVNLYNYVHFLVFIFYNGFLPAGVCTFDTAFFA